MTTPKFDYEHEAEEFLKVHGIEHIPWSTSLDKEEGVPSTIIDVLCMIQGMTLKLKQAHERGQKEQKALDLAFHGMCVSGDGTKVELLETVHTKGIAEGLRRGAELVMKIWKDAPNDEESRFKQNRISHGCIASNKALLQEAKRVEEQKGNDHGTMG